MKKNGTKKLVLMAVFTALAIVVGFIEIPWPIGMFGLKIDFSEVVILISLLFLGFPRTVVIVVLRSALREILLPKSAELIPYIGEIMAIYSSIVLMVLYLFITWLTRSKTVCVLDAQTNVKCDITGEKSPFIAPFIYHQPPLWKLIIHNVFVVIGFTALMLAANIFVTIPIYLSGGKHFFITSFLEAGFYSSVYEYVKFVVTVFGLFNLVKGVLVMIVFEIIKVRVMRLDISRL